MNRLGTLTLTTIAALLLGVALPSGNAAGQQKTLKEQLVGTWTYVSVDTVHPDGSRVPIYGASPQGFASFDSHGHYILMTTRSGLPRFASNNRMQGTPEENKAVVQGSIAHFGRYTVNEADTTITFHIESSTFPNWNGVDQKRPFTLTGGELKWTTPASSGGSAEVEIEALAGQDGGDVTIANHPFTPVPGFPAVIGKSKRFRFNDYGFTREISDRNGFYSPFAYQG